MARAPRRVRTRAEYESLTPKQHELRIRAANIANAMRADPTLSLRRAAAREGMRPEAARAYASEAFEQVGARWRATRADRMPFVMKINTTDGLVERMVRGSEKRSLIGQHHNAVSQYLATGDTTVLEPFAGKHVAGMTLETRPDELEQQWMRGELEFLEIYATSEAIE
jgi:hypothetical protein